ncbi:carbon-nitrogen hydrolase family protein [Kushneria phyllosphaerae]|uniref:(R)-stereoselective amidase n=1 Tax=Kushneria phyllosphaerae TaxID=2100822 RepID=A0A2R8CGV5_9GAMM|nr:carbon-nitrogen hydrolase family protein [Kushneria phyllosphaerae]SPJ32126.1 (R)-stereoselective amidase [Kushneria phyllosphaerae]
MTGETHDITVALAQAPVIRGAVADNLSAHLRYIEQAARHGADVVMFPELSLIGYEPDLLEPLAMSDDAEVFTTLSDAAMAHHLVVIAGCPLINDGSKPRIGAVICFPDGERTFYAKQHLHDGEAVYCAPGHESCLFTVNGVRLALAVCADFAHPAHAEAAAAQNAQVYLVSALISESGYDADAELLAGIARRHQFPVLLSNHISNTGGWQTCGKSGSWAARGERVAGAEGNDAGLVLCTIKDGVLDGASEQIIAMEGVA